MDVLTGAAEQGADERAYSQQKVLRDQPFQIMSNMAHGCTVVSSSPAKGRPILPY